MIARIVVPAALLVLLASGDRTRGGTPSVDGPAPTGAVRTLPAEQGGMQEGPFGSAVPCAVPLRWRLGRVAPEFGLGDAAARRAVAEAARLWESVLGRRLFTHDPVDGFPVVYEYDDRQAVLELRRRLERELGETGRGVEGRRAELEDARETFEAVRSEYEGRVEEYGRRRARYGETVRRWNERGDVPEEVRSELRRTAEALEAERASLSRQRQELRQIQEWLMGEAERLNREIREQNRRSEALARDLPATRVESGVYRESVRTRNGDVVSVDREIRVFRFEDRSELIRVLAHELGHALGLGHAAEPGAVMSEVAARGDGPEGAPRIHPRDLEMLRSRCPEL